MGHADIQTTMRYLHYAPRDEDAALVAEAFALEPTPSAQERGVDSLVSQSCCRAVVLNVKRVRSFLRLSGLRRQGQALQGRRGF
jgi:hypothetical protein